jgi:two-component system chemotaxis family response regulator WspR
MSSRSVDIDTLSPERSPMVVLVDDQDFVAEVIRRQLAEERDINFHYCPDPAQAIKIAEEVSPTVLLLDLVMPDIDGLTLTRFIRANPGTRDIPIVILSSEENPAVKAEAFATGANDYLIKLPDRIELVARVRYHSAAFLNKIQRDAAYTALRASQQELAAANLELMRLVRIDGLTGLANRRYFDEYLDTEWLRNLRAQQPISLIMIDVDFFKRYNDTYGHMEGDRCLQRVAEVIRNVLSRPSDLTARYGGEEFCALLPLTPPEGAYHLAQNLCARVEQLKIIHPASDIAPHVTVSAGVAGCIPVRGTKPESLVARADAALYRAKDNGRNQAAMAE